jgi:hypothetical protein
MSFYWQFNMERVKERIWQWMDQRLCQQHQWCMNISNNSGKVLLDPICTLHILPACSLRFSIPHWYFAVIWVPVTTTRRVLGLQMETTSRYGRVAATILNKKSRDATRGGPPPWGLGEGLTTPHHKKKVCYEILYRTSELDGFIGTTQATENGYDLKHG